jgi:2-keto-3-deoxy-L-rhamnonate aldolase RhmA
LATIERVGRMAIAAGKAAGTIARDPAAYERWRRLGFRYLCTGVTNFLAAAAEGYLRGCREREEALGAGR